MNCFKHNCNNDKKIYNDALEKIDHDQQFKPSCCSGIVGPTGPTGPTGPSGGPTGATGPTGPTARLVNSSNK